MEFADKNSSPTIAAALNAQGTAADELGLLEEQVTDLKLEDHQRVDLNEAIALEVKCESKFYDDANEDLMKQFEGVKFEYVTSFKMSGNSYGTEAC